MRLASHNLLELSDIDGPQLINQYLNRNILLTFGKSGSFVKRYHIQSKYTLFSDVLFKIKNFPVQLANQKVCGIETLINPNY